MALTSGTKDAKIKYYFGRQIMVKVMEQSVKDRIADLERQKIALEDQLELVGNNLVKMHEIESEIYEIDDTIRKLTA